MAKAATKSAGADVYINVRFPQALVDRMDTHIATLRARTPGLTVTRSDVLRMAVEEFTRADDGEEGEPKPAPAKKAAGRR